MKKQTEGKELPQDHTQLVGNGGGPVSSAIRFHYNMFVLYFPELSQIIRRM